MATSSRCADEAAGAAGLYSEAQRLALEELVAGGRDAFRAFLRRERVAEFLSEPELQALLAAAVPPREEAEEPGERSLDCSSLTYFPERSDAEPPALELGWPGFASGAFRGLPRVEAHFQPGFGAVLYGCKEAVRREIRSAREVIAVVMDCFTDIDIFGDLLEACGKREVAVYILLDQEFVSHFMKMCSNLGVSLEQKIMMKVRTITGNIYYARSGAKIVGKAREKFMLIDGIRVTTGSYSFTWTDGKLNSSNLLVLSGQVVERFDLEFRILYAQSQPLSSEVPASCRNSGIFDQQVNKKPSKEYTVGYDLRAELARLSSTPKKPLKEMDLAEDNPGGTLCKLGHPCLGEEQWLSSQEVLISKQVNSMPTQTDAWEKPRVVLSNAVTQTDIVTVTTGTQTSVDTKASSTQTAILLKTAVTQTDKDEHVEEPSLQRRQSKDGSSASAASSLCSQSSSSSRCSLASSVSSMSSLRSTEYSSYHRADNFHTLHKERQFHYSVIRSKLNHVMDLLARRNHVPEHYVNRHIGRCNLKQRRDISTSLLSLRDIAPFRSNK
ncbi:PREDICTED: protein FAM83D [Crocodylus porosus]|uniref:Family with sequence similarity 83 member D n=1 Tax=Crocodylus porosus TaxID=8502 RepID=A0A7M4F1W3_CROPO|nr:PREDICTED: protein FAM83D [Crocodylus porosus]